MNELHLTKPKTVRTFRAILLIDFFPSSQNVFASVTPVAADITLKTYIASFQIQNFKKLTGKKIALFQKIKFMLLQKKLQKLKLAPGITENQKKWFRLSMIFGIGSLALLILSTIFILGIWSMMAIAVAVVAIVYGVQSLKGNSNKKGIIGIVTGGITLAFVITAF